MDASTLDALVERMSGIDDLDQASIVRGAAFTLLRLVGHLGDQDRVTALRCIDHEITTISDPDWLSEEARRHLVPALHVQRDDLLSWSNPDT